MCYDWNFWIQNVNILIFLMRDHIDENIKTKNTSKGIFCRKPLTVRHINKDQQVQLTKYCWMTRTVVEQSRNHPTNGQCSGDQRMSQSFLQHEEPPLSLCCLLITFPIVFFFSPVLTVAEQQDRVGKEWLCWYLGLVEHRKAAAGLIYSQKKAGQQSSVINRSHWNKTTVHLEMLKEKQLWLG